MIVKLFASGWAKSHQASRMRPGAKMMGCVTLASHDGFFSTFWTKFSTIAYVRRMG
jgi:hypothetical protein